MYQIIQEYAEQPAMPVTVATFKRFTDALNYFQSEVVISPSIYKIILADNEGNPLQWKIGRG